METILIATDFSSAARNATRYGFELSKAMNAKVILFTAYQNPLAHPESLVHLPLADVEKATYQKLADEAETFDPNATVVLETLCRPGPIGDTIVAAAAKNNVSFIVIGMKQTGKEYRKYFGSTVTLLSKQSSIPLVVVPEEAAFAIPKTIAYASDINHETNIHVLDPLKKIALTFNSFLSIVRVIKPSMDEYAERLIKSDKLEWFLSRLNHSYKYLKNDNIAKAINLYVKESSVDLIAVAPHEHNMMERLFTRSVTKDLIFHTHVPLLVLPLKEAPEPKVAEQVYTSNYYASVC